jgi:hypothetical protein
MDQADRKLRIFYQYQIAKIAKFAREQTHPASRKRLDFLLNQYIDMLLVMPRANHAARAAGCRGVTSRPPVAVDAVSCPKASGLAVAPAFPVLVVPPAAVALSTGGAPAKRTRGRASWAVGTAPFCTEN